MKLLDSLLTFIDVNLISCLIPMILTLIVIEAFSDDKLPTKKALGLICWIIISYVFVSSIKFIFELVINTSESVFSSRWTGPYYFAYWMMFFFSIILPYTLLFNKLANTYWYVLIIALFIRIGAYLEYFVIVSSSLRRDYDPTDFNEALWPWALDLIMNSLQGFVIAFCLLGLFILLEKRKSLVN